MVPDCVPGVMDHWKILSLEMTSMEKGRPWPYLSVCAASSHDMAPVRMQHEGKIGPDGVRDILAAHFHSASMLSIHPIQDYLAIDEATARVDWENERVNNPADPNHHWRYRLHMPLEQLSAPISENMTKKVIALLKESNR